MPFITIARSRTVVASNLTLPPLGSSMLIGAVGVQDPSALRRSVLQKSRDSSTRVCALGAWAHDLV